MKVTVKSHIFDLIFHIVVVLGIVFAMTYILYTSYKKPFDI